MFRMYQMYRGKIIDSGFTDYTGVKRDMDQSLAYLQRAATSGSNRARIVLGKMYQGDGISVPTNHAAARTLYEQALRSSYAKPDEKGAAAYQLGNLYYDGKGVPKSVSQSVSYFKQAGGFGHSKSYYYLGLMYGQALGVPKSNDKAFEYLLKAAKLGHVDAQYTVAFNFLKGEGTAVNHHEGRKWLAEAAENGHAKAKTELTELDQYFAKPK